jgi:hypothetical protein
MDIISVEEWKYEAHRIEEVAMESAQGGVLVASIPL